MLKHDPVAAFYTHVLQSGHQLVLRHRFIPQLGKFMWVARCTSEAAAKTLVERSRIQLGCKEPRAEYNPKHKLWQSLGFYRPLIDAPVESPALEEELA